MLHDIKEFSTELRLLIRARFPLLHIATHEEDRALAVVNAVGAELGKKVIIWSTSRGVHNPDYSPLGRSDLLDGVPGPFPTTPATGAALSELATALTLFDRLATHKDRHKAGYLFVLLDP